MTTGRVSGGFFGTGGPDGEPPLEVNADLRLVLTHRGASIGVAAPGGTMLALPINDEHTVGVLRAVYWQLMDLARQQRIERQRAARGPLYVTKRRDSVHPLYDTGQRLVCPACGGEAVTVADCPLCRGAGDVTADAATGWRE